MPSRSDTALAEMRRALAALSALVGRHSENSFLADPDAPAAAAMHLLIVGESADNLDPEIRDSLPDVPWRSIIALRHRLAHGYYRQDERQLWDTAVDSAPALHRQLPPRPDAAED